MRIPFNRPYVAGKELYYIAKAVLGGHTAGDGPFTKQCNALLQNILDADKVMLTTSCTAALEIAALLIGAREGDEIIMPSFTFVSTANAFYLRGAKPRFVDIREDSLNIDERLIEEAISARTKGIVPVHYAGVACEMDEIKRIADTHRLMVVEDAAHALGATYKGKKLGTLGDLAAFSFHETKNLICGEGGALVVNNGIFAQRAEILREKGTNRSRFLRGEVDKYSWVDVGSSYLPSDILAAFLFAQLEHIDDITKRRTLRWQRYRDELQPLEDAGVAVLPGRSTIESGANHLFYLILNTAQCRDDLMSFLKERGIHAVFHYVPLHASPVGEALGYRRGQFPVTESVASRLLRLPLHNDLPPSEQEQVISSVIEFLLGQPRGRRQ